MTQLGPEQIGQSKSSISGQAHGVADEMRGAARDVADEARATDSSLRAEAAGLGGTIKQGFSDQVERQKNGIADRLTSVAERAHKTADDLREHEAWLGDLLGRGAHELEGIADEIRRNDVPGMLGSVEVFARRQPALFMGAAVALGFALTRVVASGAGSSDRHDDAADQWRGDQTRHAGAGSYAGRAAVDPVVAGSNI